MNLFRPYDLSATNPPPLPPSSTSTSTAICSDNNNSSSSNNNGHSQLQHANGRDSPATISGEERRKVLFFRL